MDCNGMKESVVSPPSLLKEKGTELLTGQFDTQLKLTRHPIAACKRPEKQNWNIKDNF